VTSEPNPYKTLADILASNKVGLEHVLLVGEVIVAVARLNRGPRDDVTQSLSAWADIVEEAVNAEDNYRKAWQDLERAEGDLAMEHALRALEESLRQALSTFRSLRTKLDELP
jgi:hypothetical protein